MRAVAALAMLATLVSVGAAHAEPTDELAAMPELGDVNLAPDDTAESASRWRLVGTARSSLTADLSPHDNRAPAELLADAAATVDLRLTPRWAASLGGRVNRRQAYGAVGAAPDSESWSDLTQATITYLGDSLSATTGRQVIRWGVADFASPNDVLSPTDGRAPFSAGLESNRLPVWALRASYGGPAGSIELAWLPRFAADRYPGLYHRFGMLGAQPELSALIDQFDEATREHLEGELERAMSGEIDGADSLSSGTAGVRGTVRSDGVDVSAQLVYGWDRLPELVVAPSIEGALAAARADSPELPMALAAVAADAMAGASMARTRYNRRIDVGADVRWTSGANIVRLEAAATPTQSAYTAATDEAPSEYDRLTAFRWSAGLERAFGDGWRASVAAFGNEVVGDRRLTPLTATSRNVAAVIRYKGFRDELEITASGQLNPDRGDWLAAVAAELDIGENVAVDAGFALIDGPQDSAGGVFADADLLYGRLTWRL